MKKPIACIIILIFIISMFSFFIPKLIARNFPPVAYWNFDEGTGNIAHDSSGNGNVGTLVSPQWVNGVSGNAVNFDGFNDYLSVPTSSSLAVQGNAMSLECWIKPGMKIDDGVNRIISIIDKGDEYTFQINPNDGRIWFAVILSPGLNWQGITTAISSWTAGTWYHIVGTYDGSYLRIYVKGILSNSRTLSGNLHPPTSFPFTIGAHSLGFDCNFNGIIDEVKVYNYARAPEQVMEDYVAVINPSEEVLGGYWAFDEGSGEFAYDSSGNENTGTLMNGPQWVKGISGTALYFDGINDWVRIPHSSSLDFTGNQMSIEFWMKLENDWYPGVSSVNPIIFCKGDALCVAALLGNTGSLRFNLPYLEPYTNSDKTNWKTDTWYHIAGVFTGSQIIIYINGEVDTAQPLTGSVPRSTLNAAIGAHCFGGKDFFNGVIDEVAIYDYARAAEDIQNDFNSVAENPVGYWKFDEGSGTVAGDSSGNGNTGTLMNGPQWVNGVSGKALKLDGINDYVYVPHSSSLDIVGNEISVEYWIKLSTDWYAELEKDYTYDQIIYDKGDAYTAAMIKKSGAHRFNIPYVPPYPETNKNHWDANTWYHLANVFDGTQIRIYVNGVLDNVESVVGSVSRSTINLAIGSHCFGGKHFFNGAIDEFAIYDYARTAEEIWNDAHALPRKPFDPIFDGFGFSNYPRQGDCMDITIRQLYDAMEYIPVPAQRVLLAIYAFTLGQLQHNAGHCYGISRVAVYYFTHHQELESLLEPLGLSTASQVSSFNSISAIRDKIEYEHVFGLWENPNLYFKKLTYILESPFLGLPSLEAEVNDIINTVNGQGYAFVSLYGTDGTRSGFHSVVAYDGKYDASSDTYTIHFYDSNWQFGGGPGSDGSGHKHTMQLTHNPQGKLYISDDGDSRVQWYDIVIHEGGSVTCTWEYIIPKIVDWLPGRLSELWDALLEFASEAPELWNQFVEWIINYAKDVWDAMVRLVLSCPANLHTYDASENHVGLTPNGSVEIGFPALFFVVGDTQQAVLVNPEAGDYRVEVVGTGKGSFTLRLSSIADGTTMSEKTISGEINEGETKTYQISCNPTSGELTIKEAFPLWVVGVVFAVVGLGAAVTLFLWRKRVVKADRQRMKVPQNDAQGPTACTICARILILHT